MYTLSTKNLCTTISVGPHHDVTKRQATPWGSEFEISQSATYRARKACKPCNVEIQLKV